MKEKHLARINKLILLGHFTATICILFESVGYWIATKTSNTSDIVVLLLELFIAAGATGVYKKYSDSVFFSRYIMVSFSIVYTVLMLTATSGNLFPYILPYILCSVLILDPFCVKLTSFSYLAINLVRIVMTCMAAENFLSVMEPVTVEFVTVILIFFASFRGLTHLNKFFDESMDEVLTASRRNETIAKKITEVAKTVEEQAEVMAQDLEVIADATQTISESMNNISAGTTSSTEAIMHQTMQTQDIQKIIDETGRGFTVVANEIRKLAEQTRKETENITLLIDALSQNAQLMTDKVDQNVEAAEIESQAAQEASRRFEEISEKTKEPVKHIKEVDATSVKNVELVRNFSKSMDHILEQIETLQQYSI